MTIEVPLFVLKLGGFFKPRYLVFQTEVRGLANTPTIVYAELFYFRGRMPRRRCRRPTTGYVSGWPITRWARGAAPTL